MLRARIVTASVLIATLAVLLFLAPRGAWTLFCALFAGGAAVEWGRLIGISQTGIRIFAASVFLGIVIWSGLPLPDVASRSIYAASLAFWVLMVPVWLWRHGLPTRPVFSIGSAALVIFAAALALSNLRNGGGWFVLFALGIVWISDTAAYFVGSQLGRHKLAPRISPGKTWEGAAGAIICVGVYALAWTHFSSGILPERFTSSVEGRLGLILLALFIAVLGIYGDLYESMLKRKAGVKDSGSLLPGHGGILDRVDALLPAMPFAALTLM